MAVMASWLTVTMNRPNIIYLHSHDTGRYIQPYGYAVTTPHLQKLAEEGVMFRQAFSAAPTCSPSRAALLTGQSPHSCGQLGLVNRGFELRDKEKHIAKRLKQAGYRTAVTGINHVASDPLSCGYETMLSEKQAGDALTAKSASTFLKQKHTRPFFLSVGFFATHREFLDPTPEDALYSLPPAPLPDNAETRRDTAALKASTRALDCHMGTVINGLKASPYANNTLIICTTDHGLAFPKMKCNLTDYGTGVMLIMSGAGFTGGKVIDAMVSHLDIYPTICELAGLALPDWLEGKSLLPTLRDVTHELHEALFAEVNYHCHYEPMRAVRTKKWKYVRRFSDYAYPMLANIDDSPSKTVLINNGFANQRYSKEELYDLTFDSNEVNNLAAKSDHLEKLMTMRARLETWMKQTNDPLLSGDVPSPKGALVSRAEDKSPNDIWTYTEQPEGFA